MQLLTIKPRRNQTEKQLDLPGPVPTPASSSSLGCRPPSNPAGSSILKHAYRLLFLTAPVPPTTVTFPVWGPPTRRILDSGAFCELKFSRKRIFWYKLTLSDVSLAVSCCARPAGKEGRGQKVVQGRMAVRATHVVH